MSKMRVQLLDRRGDVSFLPSSPTRALIYFHEGKEQPEHPQLHGPRDFVRPADGSDSFSRCYGMKGNTLETSVVGTNKRLRRAPAEEPFPSEAQAAFQRLVMDFNFPCLGAKAAFNSAAVSYGFYGELGTDASTKNLARDLERFTHAAVAPGADQFATLIAVFRGPFDLAELEFERLLWEQLSKLDQVDAPNFPWDARVSSDPNAPDFSFSFVGQTYYVIGMHANASRRARRFPWPTLVFNPHEQFERLRTDGNWERMKQTIRARDFELQGSVNPMLSDFGEQSEARQYSGRAVEENWRAPFKAPNPRKCPFGD